MEKLSLEGLNFQATKLDIANHIMTITLNRPEKKNALNNVMMNELNYSLAYAKQERSIRVVVIAAEGDVFCAGADLTRAESESNIPKIEGVDDISLSIHPHPTLTETVANAAEVFSGTITDLYLPNSLRAGR